MTNRLRTDGTTGRVTFVTGTDTGVGKTVLTGLMLIYLRRRGVHALAMKPFCTGDRHDARFLAALQQYELSVEELNPVYFPEPLAPFAAAFRRREAIDIAFAVACVRAAQKKCDWLIIEGVGGALVPLTSQIKVVDVITELDCEVVVVAPNRLGTINHTLLTLEALSRRGIRPVKVVLMDQKKPDLSSRSNPRILKELIAPVPVFRLPFLGPKANFPSHLERYFPKAKKILAQILR
ncbi:MAG: dethiobiotin synthase [Verrucomicrobiae bacterium]|nr:dethiobiotin synthase [Verrucomicrobiae bacterium]MDW7979192.1 dethiobiotin synthase [Verrucomicrobiales bacterium]